MLKSNKIKKVLSVLLIVFAVVALVMSISTVVNADQWEVISGSNSPAVGKVQNWGSIILGVFQAVGMSIAVIMLVWIGVKYLLASPDGKAEIKKQAFAYIVGAVLLFAAGAIVGVIKGVVDSESGDSPTTSYVQTIEDVQKS